MIKVSTKEMSREDWLKARNGTIGGSDAAALLGLSKYTSPYALWAEKTGAVTPEDISDKEAVRLGNDLEQYVAERWMEATGKKLRRENNILYNAEYPWAHANIDRAVIGEPDAGFEAKTTSSFEILQQCRSGQYPDRWYCQMTHYMMITGAKRWYLGVLVFGHGFFHFTIERNEDEIKALAEAEKSFWELVQTNTPPAVDGSEATMDAIKAIHKGTAEGTVDLFGVRLDLTMFTKLGQQIAELEAQQNACKAKIMETMGECVNGITDGFKVSWKPQTRSTFDRAKFEKENGKIDKKYFKESTSRAFRVTEL